MPDSSVPALDLSVILPAYNEGAHIYRNIGLVCQALEGLRYEIVVVDDGSTDNTFAESQRAASEGRPVYVVRHEINRGKGASLFRGFEFTSADRVAFLDSDLEIAPENLLHLLRVMDETQADVVIGVKYKQVNEFPALRRGLSRLYQMLVAFLFDLSVSDTQTGIKLFRREVLVNAIPRVSVRRFAFDLELLVAALRFGYRIVEQPVQVAYHRMGRLGRINLSAMFTMFLDTLAIFYRTSFWRWLNPSLMAKTWMVLLALGIFLTGVGFAKLLTPVIPPGFAKQFFYLVLLQFFPLPLRNWLILFLGILLVIVSLIQLNKIIMAAFARYDQENSSGPKK